MATTEGTQRVNWVEPEVRELAVAETSALSGTGGADGETIWTDCTLS
jgi:hypothetical protein